MCMERCCWTPLPLLLAELVKDEGALVLIVAEDVVAAAAKQVRDDDAAV